MIVNLEGTIQENDVEWHHLDLTVPPPTPSPCLLVMKVMPFHFAT